MSYLGEEIKKLGFGLMRLPQKDGKIDIEQTKTMVDMILVAGFTTSTPLGHMREAKTRFVRRSSNAIRATNSASPRKMPLGATVKHAKTPFPNLTPL